MDLLSLRFLLTLTLTLSAYGIPNGVLSPRAEQSCTTKPSAPKGLHCGVHGSLSSPAYTNDAQKVASVDACRDLCARHRGHPEKPNYYAEIAGCYIFSFDTASHICQFYHESYSTMGFTANTSSTTVFYATPCFDCPAICPNQPIGAALFDNPGFESNPTLAGPWATSGGSVTSPGHASSHAFTCTGSCSLNQYVDVCPGAVYHLTFSYLATASPLIVSAYGASLEADSQHLIVSNASTWRTASYWLAGDRLALLEVGLEFSGAGAHGLQLDDITLTRVSPAFEPAPGATELVVNGGFESGALAPWAYAPGGRSYHAAVVTPGLNGSAHAVQLTGHVTDDSAEAGLGQRISGLVPGEAYLLTFNAARQGGGAEYPEVYVDGLLYEPAGDGIGGPATLNFSMPFMATSRKAVVQLDYYYGPLLVDNVSVKKLG